VTIAQAPNAASNLVWSPAPFRVRAGEQLQLNASVDVAGPGVTATITFTSTNTARATVSSTGLVTGVSPGSASIFINVSASGGGFQPNTFGESLPITVTNPLGTGFGDEQFASIPAGSGLRGSNNGNADEQPVRTIFVSAFSIQRTEVTQGQWRQVMAGTALANPSGFATCGDSCPVEQVTYDDVQLFITRLNQQDPGKGYRLPTEAEWEWAARGGTTGDLNVAGRTVEELAWISTNSQGRTRPVAQKLPNAYGLYDTIGNVWEWVNDWYSATYYSNAPPVDPPGPATGTRRSLRGSSWFFNSTFARVAIRENLATTDRTDALGFRLARNP
jgi:formylglycine-generating enzyme required for sulfatase activity